MAPSCRHPTFTVAMIFTVAFIFFLTVLPPKSGGSVVMYLKDGKKVIGSKPPACVNKCKKCRPCMATLVIPNHRRNKGISFKVVSPGEDDTYYLLSWKCRCGDRLFQP